MKTSHLEVDQHLKEKKERKKRQKGKKERKNDRWMDGQ